MLFTGRLQFMCLSDKGKKKELGFTLFELMIAIAIIAILTAMGIPAYQNYIQKAALVDMLQFMSPYKTAIELCVLEEGNPKLCDNRNIAVSAGRLSHYVSSISIDSGTITLEGKHSLSGLIVTITPVLSHNDNTLIWQRSCRTSPKNTTLENACNALFKY